MANCPKYMTNRERALCDTFEQRLRTLSDTAAELTRIGMDVHVEGWTLPGTTGTVRLQGNTGYRIERSERYVEQQD